ncbi:hypothetical protein OV079_15265 [Nannocystis pusilla]|uniref:Uncharacterized protein n=1 Tax=Nannocystis pusilla TaxID=889268 RepID=A0A9X3EMQ7_9BACT|nr:hypothetical protein [Nannocystis pusilla]MCY1006889.1 hypothetical protein [Nannocystis pusilla]
MGPLLDYLPLVAAVGLIGVLAGLVRARARQQAAPDAGEGLVQLRPRQPVDTGGLLALAGLGFALALALVLFAPTAAVCLSSTTCPEGPALWVSAAGLGLLGLATAIAWPSLTRAP